MTITGSFDVGPVDGEWARIVYDYISQRRTTEPRFDVAWETDVPVDVGDVWQLEGIKLWSVPLRIEFARRPPVPWWAKLIGWGIAVYYAVRG